MKPYLYLFIFYMYSSNSFAGCDAPYGVFKAASYDESQMYIEINMNQILKIKKGDGEKSKIIYQGRFTNFDEMVGTEYLNFENAIDIEPFDKKKSHICLHINDDCSGMKVDICRRALDFFGGEPPKLEERYFLKND